jgi:hypothetical protein
MDEMGHLLNQAEAAASHWLDETADLSEDGTGQMQDQNQ